MDTKNEMDLKKDSRTRKWQITINNPIDKGYTHDWIKAIIKSLNQVVYWCMSDEIGEEGTHHTHIYISFSAAVRFSTIKAKFNGGHLEMCKGTSAENRDYIFAQGKHAKKACKNLIETHEEDGQMPIERQGARNDLADLYDMIKQGMSNKEIIEEMPKHIFNGDKIDRVRQMLREEKYRKSRRMITTTYVVGDTGLGKTRDIMEQYEDDVYRVTDYDHPFDGYAGEDVVVFEEFRSNLRISDMLNYLDIYPMKLPARYYQRVACFTKVYIVTNIPIEQQYVNVQKESKSTWEAFLRRIHFIKEYTKDGVTEKPRDEAYWYTEDAINLPV